MTPYKFRRLVAGLTLLATPAFAQSSDDYPSRPIHIIVPTAAAGSIDMLARALGKHLPQTLGRPVIVENRPGAATNIGSDHVAKAPPDGYTLLINGAPLAANPWLFKKFPFKPTSDLAPVIEVGEIANVITVHPQVPAKSLPELIELVRSRPGDFNYGTTGLGSSGHLAAELLGQKTGIRLTHVTYRGNAQAATDHIAGILQVGFVNLPVALPFIKDQRIRALAVTSSKRSKMLPDVPTVAEALQLPDYESLGWFGLFAPTGTPEAIVERLHDAAQKALDDAAVSSSIRQAGAEPLGGSRQQLADRLERETRIAKQLIEFAGAANSQ
ncbi:tripartite tricarboxylate transporter substrate binding protein [Pigmentiphaga sp. GD03639]|jgi:tripartite-type tricarboxylate transporter receptor subunit TctC|uniref:Tripartite-type tricarboxylate transporter receptor subunit TctC n=1 Tax=Pigmentiphaga kullae TaxID=151784 RepID=A0A4Q7NJL2_9BURK|nr:MULTISPECIES: tripartite tricarboxylate transporter substrate binding protein [Pigmentiphaga]MDH2237445.1 tripartite tricarboxylate transporter substrate binding protein [Pigmentiphaga sp. GD03639]OVZ63112.1 hypothetical protein CDO46_12605 [Pigmentiphaga sp. NML030171]RZS85261.1 tripartite-type tricarboxylate transporter receptor subunit TctC [Pigmentiphaga kullae]